MKKIIISSYRDKNLLIQNGKVSKYLSNNSEVLSGGPTKVLWCHSTSVGAESWEWEFWYYDGGWVKIDDSRENTAIFRPPTVPGTYYIKLTINGTLSIQSTSFLITQTPYNVMVTIVSDPIYYNAPLTATVISALEVWAEGFIADQTITYAEIIAFVESVEGVHPGDVFGISVWHLVDHVPVDYVDPIIPNFGEIVAFELIRVLAQPT